MNKREREFLKAIDDHGLHQQWFRIAINQSAEANAWREYLGD